MDKPHNNKTNTEAHEAHEAHDAQHMPIITYWDDLSPFKTICEIIYVNEKNELHRSWKEGPAYIYYYNRNSYYKSYNEQRYYNRDIYIYYQNGKPHRPMKEGAAVTYFYNNPNNNMLFYVVNGLLIRNHQYISIPSSANPDVDRLVKYFSNFRSHKIAYTKRLKFYFVED